MAPLLLTISSRRSGGAGDSQTVMRPAGSRVKNETVAETIAEIRQASK